MNTVLPIQLLSPCGIALSMDAMVQAATSRNQVNVPASTPQMLKLSSWALPNERAALGEKTAPDSCNYDTYNTVAFYPS